MLKELCTAWIYEWAQEDSVFVPDEPFHPSRKFASKAGAYPNGAPLPKTFEKYGRDQQSRVVQGISDNEEKFILTLAPTWSVCCIWHAFLCFANVFEWG